MNKTCLVVTEMVRFFCFSAKIHYHRSKKEIPQNKSMSKASEDYSKVQRSNSPEQDTTFAVENWDKPGEMHSETSSESNIRVHQKTGFKRSQSLGTLDREGIVSGSEDEDETDREIKCDKDLSPDSFQGDKEGVTNESIFSIEYTKQLEEYNGDLTNSPPHEYDDDTEHLATSGLSMMAKSCSLPDIGLFSPTSKDGSSFHGYQVRHCRSFEDLSHLNEKNKASQDRGVEFDVVEYQEREDYMTENTKGKHEDFLGERDGFESYNYLDTRDWATDEINVIGEDKGESSAQNLNALPSKDFKIKLIEEWVSAIELDESSSLQDISESHHSINKAKRGSLVLGSSSTAKLDTKNIHGMEAAKNYISALPPTATTAQLSNLGLAVVPFLSAFVHLKSLNLSGNAIVRITSGALPRGLHVLNLSKNNISSIEGLRELARLRVLNLSYNRILRIGHGLASCSSLKELYLAGNKISEVEGLHRLLKLNVLDLRFNKISTAKCLGQLAANYSSLQAINLEGNPAQRNVGDEQLKKYLQRCLPHLVYYNKKTIKATSSKEVADRAARLAIASHQPERGLRSEHNLVRKSNVSSGKASSSRHGHRFQAGSSTKLSKDIHGRLPPSGAKGTHHHHYLELGSKLLGLRSNSSMRRSRSEGNLGAP